MRFAGAHAQLMRDVLSALPGGWEAGLTRTARCAHHAVLLRPDKGAHAGEVFLLVDADGASIADEELFLDTLIVGEIRKGIELARPREAGKAAALERWLREVESVGGFVLGVDNAISDQWGCMGASDLFRSLTAFSLRPR